MTMPPRRLKMFPSKFSAAACGLMCLALLAGCNSGKQAGVGGGSAAGSGAGGASSGVMKAAAVRAEKKTLVRTMEQPGQIVPLETTPLMAKVAGYVKEVKKDIGDVVKPGETLAVIAAPELLEEVKQKEANLKQAESGIMQARAGVKVAESTVVKARALEAELQSGVDRAVADQKRWTSEHERIKELSGQGSVTTKLLDETENKLAASAAATAEARAKFRSASASIVEAEARVVQARADLEAAESQKLVAVAARDAALQMTDYLTIVAPYAGMVTARNIDTGHFVAPAASGAAKPLFVVVRADKVRVVVGVPEGDAQFANAGDKAVIRVFALGDRTISEAVQVTRTALTLDHDSGTLRTEIDLDNAAGELRPGLYVNATIELERRAGVVAVPTTAVFMKEGKPACVVVVDGKAEIRRVTKGLTAGTEVEIMPSAIAGEGVREGELVVAKNAATIPAGQPLEGVLPPPVK
ncbi:MAG: hypothetical protein C0483_21630 [Pirellula sp.]|nr:hypothetical protein [Pirellula sp.]